MKVLVGLLFLAQLHGMEVYDSQMKVEYPDTRCIALLYAKTLNEIPKFIKPTHVDYVQKKHVPTDQDKEISPRSTKNVLKYSAASKKNGSVSLKKITVQSSENLNNQNTNNG